MGKSARRSGGVSSFADRFRSTYELRGITKAEIARRLGITAQSVQKYETGGRPDLENLKKLADLLQVSADWLLTGRGSDIDDDHMLRGRAKRGGRSVPKYDAASAANDDFTSELGHYNTYFACGPRSFLIEVWDDSNAPKYEPGDICVIDPDAALKPGRMVFGSASNPYRPILGRYVRRSENGKTLEIIEHINKAWGEHLVDGVSVTVKGVVTEHASPGDP